jgi:hypothetical protein
MVNVSDIIIGGKSPESFPYFWRFLTFLTNSISLSRDLDSRLSEREVEYIRRWEKSGKDYFVIRDHPWHSPYPSGLLGIKNKIDLFESHFHNYISSHELVWGTDQDILEKYFVDKNNEDVFYCGYDKLETYIPRDNKDFFIGMQIDENENPTVPSATKSLDFLNELNLPTNYRKSYTYFFTTLAINKFYFENSLKFFMKLHDLTKNCYLNITTTKKDLDDLFGITNLTISEFKEKYPKIILSPVEDFNFRMNFPLDMNGVGFTFNVNLKSLSIKSCLKSKHNFDYLIYVDGDWHVHDEFNEEKIMGMFETMEKNNIDFGFERPAKIADGRKNPPECFYMEKLYDYNCLENNMWDEAHVANEQFLVFKNNWKLTLFQQKWEQMLWYTVMNNIRNYAEGFEIGVSALESGMKWDFYIFPLLRSCFYFYPKYSEVRHTRF